MHLGRLILPQPLKKTKSRQIPAIIRSPVFYVCKILLFYINHSAECLYKHQTCSIVVRPLLNRLRTRQKKYWTKRRKNYKIDSRLKMKVITTFHTWAYYANKTRQVETKGLREYQLKLNKVNLLKYIDGSWSLPLSTIV